MVKLVIIYVFASYFIEYIRIYTVNCWFSNRNIVMYGIVLQCIVIVLYCWCCRRMFFFFNIYLNYKKKEISITDWLLDVLFICSFNCFFFELMNILVNCSSGAPWIFSLLVRNTEFLIEKGRELCKKGGVLSP